MVDIIEIIDKLMEVSLYFKFDHFEFSMQDFDGQDHATRVLIAVGAPEQAFGRTLGPDDILVWTIYHGYTAL